jgi:hypothetical protein
MPPFADCLCEMAAGASRLVLYIPHTAVLDFARARMAPTEEIHVRAAEPELPAMPT